MIISCEECSATLQLDETKVTTESFSIRCPKCKNLIRVSMRGANVNSNGGGVSIITPPPAANSPRNADAPPANNNAVPTPAEPPKTSDAPPPAAAAFKEPENAAPRLPPDDGGAAMRSEAAKSPDNSEILQLLMNLLQQNNAGAASSKIVAEIDETAANHKILLCIGAEQRAAAAGLLTEAGYRVLAPDSLTQAIETLREAGADAVVFAPNFAPQHTGAAVLQKHINALGSNERRRTFVVALDDKIATYDTHEAFLRNLNLIINSNDARNLPHILKRGLREFEELYKHFNAASAA